MRLSDRLKESGRSKSSRSHAMAVWFFFFSLTWGCGRLPNLRGCAAPFQNPSLSTDSKAKSQSTPSAKTCPFWMSECFDLEYWTSTYVSVRREHGENGNQYSTKKRTNKLPSPGTGSYHLFFELEPVNKFENLHKPIMKQDCLIFIYLIPSLINLFLF